MPSRLTDASYPLIPIWPGFVIDTLFYAALLWLIWQTPLFLRRRYRRKHNRCPRCGYDLAGLAPNCPCPECGPFPTDPPYSS